MPVLASVRRANAARPESVIFPAASSASTLATLTLLQVLVAFDTSKTSYEAMLKLFWENHDPTQGMRQGNDVGTQYRSAIYATTPEQLKAAEASRATFQAQLNGSGYGEISTEIGEAGPFYYAEAYHQQYLAKNPSGYCGLGGTGVSCPIGTGVNAA